MAVPGTRPAATQERMAHRTLGFHALAEPGAPVLELVSSCEPCMTCFGATRWSHARRLACGAAREDVEAIGFDEGPVTETAWRHLPGRGVEVARGILRNEARAMLQRYQDLGRPIY